MRSSPERLLTSVSGRYTSGRPTDFIQPRDMAGLLRSSAGGDIGMHRFGNMVVSLSRLEVAAILPARPARSISSAVGRRRR
jgi:hypothetical protein